MIVTVGVGLVAQGGEKRSCTRESERETVRESETVRERAREKVNAAHPPPPTLC